MRIHLGHHFYGAGNLGDDFMLAGFLAALRSLAPQTAFTACVPFPLVPLQRRFPEITWSAYTEADRRAAIRDCDAWLGLGGSPFQSAQSRWFIDHLVADAALCREFDKPMFYLGVGVQTAAELELPDVRELCRQAARIWTRDAASAERLSGLHPGAPVHAAADVAHIFFRACPPPNAKAGRLTVVPNFDFAAWPGASAFLQAAETLPTTERVWLAQESRELPGAEKALHRQLSPSAQDQWRLVSPECPGSTLAKVLQQWPSGEWLVSARYHAALAGAWAGSKTVVISTNEKLRGAAQELGTPTISPDADDATIVVALQQSRASRAPVALAAIAFEACAAFISAAAGR